MLRSFLTVPVLALALVSSIATSGSGTTPPDDDGDWTAYDSESGFTAMNAGEVQRSVDIDVIIDADAVDHVYGSFITVRGTVDISGDTELRVGLLGVYDYGNTFVEGDSYDGEIEFFVDAATLLDHCEIWGDECIAEWSLVFTNMENSGTMDIEWTIDAQVYANGGDVTGLELYTY